MQYNVAQLMKEHTGAVRHYEVNEPIRHLKFDDMTIEGPLTGDLHFMKDTDGILVTGQLHTHVGVECVRCLEACVIPVDVEIEEQFFPTVDVETGRRVVRPADAEADVLIDSHHILDLTEVVRQGLVLATPMQPTHPEGCAPIETEDDGDALEVPTDPRWEALAALRNGEAEER